MTGDDPVAVGTGKGAARCHLTLQETNFDPGTVDVVDLPTVSIRRVPIGPVAVRAKPPTVASGLGAYRRHREDVSSLCPPAITTLP